MFSVKIVILHFISNENIQNALTMEKIKVGINGFGRIGRNVFRIICERPNLEIVGVDCTYRQWCTRSRHRRAFTSEHQVGQNSRCCG